MSGGIEEWERAAAGVKESSMRRLQVKKENEAALEQENRTLSF